LNHEQFTFVAADSNPLQVVEADEERVGDRNPALEVKAENRLGVITDGVER